jgi:hypothetical protein
MRPSVEKVVTIELVTLEPRMAFEVAARRMSRKPRPAMWRRIPERRDAEHDPDSDECH